LLDYLAVFIDFVALVVDVATIKAAVSQHELILRPFFVIEMELGCLRNDVVIPFKLLLADIEYLLQVVLDHGYLFAECIDLDHLLEIVSEMIIVFLRVLVVDS
jgi:hypothetical protein